MFKQKFDNFDMSFFSGYMKSCITVALKFDKFIDRLSVRSFKNFTYLIDITI